MPVGRIVLSAMIAVSRLPIALIVLPAHRQFLRLKGRCTQAL